MYRIAFTLAAALLILPNTAWGVEFTHQELVRGRTQTSMPDGKTPAVFPRPPRSSFLEGNARFRLQDDENRLALAGDLSMYMQTLDTGYQAIPNEFYVDLAPHPIAGFNVGRKKLLYGSGMAQNPSDWLNVAKDPFNPQSQRVGAYVAAAEARWETFVATALFSPQVTANLHGLPQSADWDEHLLLGRIYLLVAETDINLLAGYDREVPRAGASFSRYVFDVIEVHAEAAARQGSARQLFGRRYVPFLRSVDWSKRAPSHATPAFVSQPDLNSERWFAQVLLGSRWMSEEGDFVSLEYLWNREGLDANEWESRMAILRALPAGLLLQTTTDDPAKQFSFSPARRNYFFLNASRPRLVAKHWLEDVGVNLAAVVNTDATPSMMLYPTVIVRRGQHVSLSAGVALPAGSPDSEFGAMPVRELYVFEINAYF